MRGQRQRLVAQQLLLGQHPVDVPGRLVRAGHERHLVPHDVRDDAGQQRVVGAAEHEGVDAGLPHRVEVLVGGPEHLGTAGEALLDVLDEARARLLRQPVSLGAAAKASG